MIDDEKNIHEADLHFYYNREERINRAPSIVKSHYDGTEKVPEKGFFKSLVSTKSSRFLLGSIVLLVIMILFVTNIDTTSNVATLNNVTLELSAFSYDESVYVTLKAHEAATEEDISTSIYFSALNDKEIVIKQSTMHSIFDGNENFYRTTFPKYDILYIECIVTLNDETVHLKTVVQE